MMSSVGDAKTTAHSSTSPRNSAVPLLGEHETEATSLSAENHSPSANQRDTKDPNKSGKRKFLGSFGKKKEEETEKNTNCSAMPPNNTFSPSTATAVNAMRPASPSKSPQPDSKPVPASPHRPSNPYPTGLPLRSSSPRPPSIADSQIFERNVQENTLPSELSPAIPAHVQIEDHIPPVSEASSLAITDNHLNPDDVEIVTATAHLPASSQVVENVPSGLQSEVSLSPQEPSTNDVFPPPTTIPGPPQLAHQESEESNYATSDPNDVRRLSFISFADVVQAEHNEAGVGSRDSSHHLPGSLSATSLQRAQSPHNRSPSPVRSPSSSHSHSHSQSTRAGVTTPPPTGSGPGSAKGVELSPGRSPGPGSPVPAQGQAHGESTIETMRQALRKTGSRDFSGVGRMSPPVSAVGGENGEAPRSSFK